MATVNYITYVEDGTKTAPGYSFRQDTDTGIYRIGSNSVGVSVGDTLVLTYATTGLTLPSGLTGAGATGATLTISGATTGATANYALFVDAGDTRLDGNLTVFGDGPHAFGSSTAINYARLRLGGTFTSGGGSTSAALVRIDGVLTGAEDDTDGLYVVRIIGDGITTQDTSDTIHVVASLSVNEPIITKGATDTITNAATVYISNAPTEGAANYALFVDTGDSRFDGLIESTVAAGSPVLKVAAGTSDTPSSSPETNAEAGWIEIQVGSDTRYIPYYT
jgi:hypothetical protein